ncbi:MAG: SDR family oxidoreductase [Deltaproteobacteria bacterium]|nr:SDR family oxidoreductase [Deltaproteobacteria bacterium]
MALLSNKTAIITGAAGGIGSAVARLFAREGAKLLIADIAAGAAKQLAEEVDRSHGEAVSIAVDVTRKPSVQEMVERAIGLWGQVDILVNVAGGALRRAVLEVEESEWDAVVDLNLKSVFLCSQAVLPVMLQQRCGKIVSISSIYGFTGSETRASYAAAKAGVAVFTKSLALEVAKMGIQVNAVAPGLAATERVRSQYTDKEWRDRVATFPTGRAAEPDEVARAVLFLAQDENSYITGQIIHVNGGCLMW